MPQELETFVGIDQDPTAHSLAARARPRDRSVQSKSSKSNSARQANGRPTTRSALAVYQTGFARISPSFPLVYGCETALVCAGGARPLLGRRQHLRPPCPVQFPQLRLGTPRGLSRARPGGRQRSALRPRNVLDAGAASGLWQAVHRRFSKASRAVLKGLRVMSAWLSAPAQVDTAERGFSFLREGPLDMRMARVVPACSIRSLFHALQLKCTFFLRVLLTVPPFACRTPRLPLALRTSSTRGALQLLCTALLRAPPLHRQELGTRCAVCL